MQTDCPPSQSSRVVVMAHTQERNHEWRTGVQFTAYAGNSCLLLHII